MRSKLITPGNALAAVCAFGATNLLMSSPSIQDTMTHNDNGNSLLQNITGVGITKAASAKSENKPNVVIMLVDNLGWGELGVYGGGELRGAATPRLDKLAAEGMLLQST